MKVRIVRHYKKYNPGDVLNVSASEALSLIQLGYGYTDKMLSKYDTSDGRGPKSHNIERGRAV